MEVFHLTSRIYTLFNISTYIRRLLKCKKYHEKSQKQVFLIKNLKIQRFPYDLSTRNAPFFNFKIPKFLFKQLGNWSFSTRFPAPNTSAKIFIISFFLSRVCEKKSNLKSLDRLTEDNYENRIQQTGNKQ